MKRRRLAGLALVVIPFAGAVAPMSLPRLANAATTIVVDTFVEVATPDCTLGHAASTCSLRGAILQANGDTGDIVSLPAGTYTLSLLASGQTDDGSNGDLEIKSNMTLKGAGATTTIIQGVGAIAPWNDRIIEVDDGGLAPIVTISDLTVTKGNDANADGAGGGGGGILNDGSDVTLNNVIADNNRSMTNGGGVSSDTDAGNGSITITNSTMSNNIALNGGGLWVGDGTQRTPVFSNLFITGNTANGSALGDAGGGGIYDALTGAGPVAFNDVMVVGNSAPNMSGGGIYDDSALNNNGVVAYNNITLANNQAAFTGGGFYAGAGFVSLTNATISGNTVLGNLSLTGVGHGGGISVGVVRAAGRVTVNNATINGNTSSTSGAGLAALGTGDQLHLHNTIVVKNTVSSSVNECFTGGSGVIDSTGYNIVDDMTCALALTTDRQAAGLDPNLGVLQNNTGPTDGAPGATSPTLTERRCPPEASPSTPPTRPGPTTPPPTSGTSPGPRVPTVTLAPMRPSHQYS